MVRNVSCALVSLYACLLLCTELINFTMQELWKCDLLKATRNNAPAQLGQLRIELGVYTLPLSQSALLHMKSFSTYKPRWEKTDNDVFEQVRHKPSCTSTEDG